MTFLILLFLAMFVYGVVTAQWGGAVLALLMTGFCYWARGQFAAQDAAAARDPARAQCPKSTEQCLCDGECECTRDSI